MPDHFGQEPAARASIRALVAQAPGVHLREISRALTLPLGTALHHLSRLESDGTIVGRRDGRYKRFFPPGDRGDREAVGSLRRPTHRRVLEAVLLEPRTQRELASHLGLARSTLSVALARLTETGVLVRETRWPEDVWRAADADGARRLLSLVAPPPSHASVPPEALA